MKLIPKIKEMSLKEIDTTMVQLRFDIAKYHGIMYGAKRRVLNAELGILSTELQLRMRAATN